MKLKIKFLGKLIIGLVILIPLLSASAQNFGPFFPGDKIDITQTCLDSTYSNITKLIAPNSTAVLDGQYDMTKNGDNYNYSYIFNTGGTWLVYGICDESGTKVAWQYSIPIGSMELSTTILYIALLAILITLLIFSLSKVTTTENFGWVIGFVSISYFMLLSIFFISYKLSTYYLAAIPFLSTILYLLFYITLILLLPLFLGMIIYLLSKVTTEKEINKLVGMGYTREEAEKVRKRR